MVIDGTLGFLGFGNMGEAIAKGLIEKDVIAAASAFVYDADPAKRGRTATLGIRWAEDPADLAMQSDALLLAVKPQSMDEALAQIRPGLTARTLLVSIAAGLPIRYFKDRLGSQTRVVRAMPNTPALVGAGATGYALCERCTEADAATAQALFAAVGIAERFSEERIDAVTALSGSGPAYFFYMVECLVNAAVELGMSEAQAATFAQQTLLGSGRLLVESGESAAQLRMKVTSKGGTTEAALKRFQEGGFKALIGAGVEAAFQRARELGR